MAVTALLGRAEAGAPSWSPSGWQQPKHLGRPRTPSQEQCSGRESDGGLAHCTATAAQRHAPAPVCMAARVGEQDRNNPALALCTQPPPPCRNRHGHPGQRHQAVLLGVECAQLGAGPPARCSHTTLPCTALLLSCFLPVSYKDVKLDTRVVPTAAEQG